MDNLILTGWGWKDYACAAALALRKFQLADVLGMSTRRLPEFLNEVSGYKNIIILGIGLTGDRELLAKAVNKLADKGVKLRWLSAIDAPDYLDEEILSKIDTFVAYADTLTDVAAQCFGLTYDDLVPLISETGCKGELLHYRQLLEAAMYVYRNYQDEKAYGDAIRHIARGDSEAKWSDHERQLIEHYKRFGNRELVGKSDAMFDLRGRINLIAPRDHARVLIFGESGTGKETVALQIHNKSPRRNEPMWHSTAPA